MQTIETRQAEAFRFSPPWLALWGILTATTIVAIATLGYGGVAVAAFVAPDLSFLAGIGQPFEKGRLPVKAVPIYNTAHRMPVAAGFTAIGTAATAAGIAAPWTVVAGLSWMAHIAMDRSFGYGLRNPDGSR